MLHNHLSAAHPSLSLDPDSHRGLDLGLVDLEAAYRAAAVGLQQVPKQTLGPALDPADPVAVQGVAVDPNLALGLEPAVPADPVGSEVLGPAGGSGATARSPAGLEGGVALLVGTYDGSFRRLLLRVHRSANPPKVRVVGSCQGGEQYTRAG